MKKAAPWAAFFNCLLGLYRVDSISNPQASKSGSGMYFEFLFRRAHSRSRVERKYWSGESLYSRTTCSNSVTVGVIGPIGSGLPQFGFPRRLAMKIAASHFEITIKLLKLRFTRACKRFHTFQRWAKTRPGYYSMDSLTIWKLMILQVICWKSISNLGWFKEKLQAIGFKKHMGLRII